MTHIEQALAQIDSRLDQVATGVQGLATDLGQLRSEMATKQDLGQLRSEMATDLGQLRSEMAT